jgi:predicted small lipoprotein YifL
MRRQLFTTVAVAALFALPACGSPGDPEPAAPAAAPTASADRAATSTACVRAISASEAGAATFKTDVELALEAVAADEDPAAAMATIQTDLEAWARMLTDLAAGQVEPDVKAALTDGAEAVTKIADPNDDTPVAEAQRILAKVGDDIEAACS